MTIAIVKYGMGNVASVQKALKQLGFSSIITADPLEIEKADFVILPGVGAFKKGMENLKASNLVEVLTEQVVHRKKPFLGICLGMQLLAAHGTEPERVEGLGWIDGEVVKMETSKKYRIPHLGWNNVEAVANEAFYGEFSGKDYYFIHSYHFKPENGGEVTFMVDYDGPIVAGVQKDNIYGLQFHPEKSQDSGLDLLKKIVNQYA